MYTLFCDLDNGLSGNSNINSLINLDVDCSLAGGKNPLTALPPIYSIDDSNQRLFNFAVSENYGRSLLNY